MRLDILKDGCNTTEWITVTEASFELMSYVETGLNYSSDLCLCKTPNFALAVPELSDVTEFY